MVISEETGAISLAAGGLLSSPLTASELEASLSGHLHSRRWGDRLGVGLRGGPSERHSGAPTTAGGDATGS